MSYVSLSWWDLAAAGLLILLNGSLSLALQLGMERRLLIAALRMIIQLTAIGFVLKFIFAQTSLWWTLGLGLVMGLIAGREVLARQERPLQGFWAYGLGTGAMMFAGGLAMMFGVGLLIRPDPWYKPEYVLPILGMMFGNTLTGVALALDTLTATAIREKNAIEARIALGHSRFEALQGVLRQAFKTGLMPIINAMAASGIVALPGMMTGQILAGADPIEATKYQILIMFLIAGATALAVFIAVFGASLRFTDERHRLRLDRLRPPTS